MKILQITPFFYPGLAGMELVTQNLSLCLAKQGHEVKILTINIYNAAKEEELAPNLNVYRCHLDFRYNKTGLSIELIRELLKARDYDIYHIHIPFILGLEATIVAARIHRVPLVITHHGESTNKGLFITLINNCYGWVYRNISLRFPDRLIFLSQSYPDSLSLNQKVRQKITVINNSADITRFSVLIDDSELRENLGLGKDDKIILFVGSLNKHNSYKGVDYLLRAMVYVVNHNSNIKLIIVGDGELLPELKKLCTQLNLDRTVIFSGAVPNDKLPPYYAICDLFVLPSISGPENAPLVLYEAMASGKAAVATDLPGVRDIVQHGKTGFLVPPKDSPALAKAIISIIENERLRREMSSYARTAIEANSWEIVAEKTASIFQTVVRR